jgi:sensor domain CHASE-containing protein
MEETDQSPSESKLRNKLYPIGALLFIVLVIIVYLWFQNTLTLREEAQEVIEQAEKYETLRSEIDEEKSRCESFIAQQEGDFGSFEYCQRFIRWTNELTDI